MYIPPGQFNQMILLRNQLQKICSENPRVVLGMDANARNILWDDDVRADSSRATKRMGEMLVDIILDNGMEIMNDGTHTYHKGQYSAALDVTAVKGVQSDFSVSWRVLEDDIRSDHSAIEFNIGEVTSEDRIERLDWKNMDWGKYEQATETVLESLLSEWENEEPDVDEMTARLTATLRDTAEGLVPTKVICKHSKPWITKELTGQLKKQRQARRKWKNRRRPRNYAMYQKIVEDTEKMLTDVKQQWWEAEINRLEDASNEQKWKILDRLTDPCVRMGVQPIKVGIHMCSPTKKSWTKWKKFTFTRFPTEATCRAILTSRSGNGLTRHLRNYMVMYHLTTSIMPASLMRRLFELMTQAVIHQDRMVSPQ